MASAASGTPQPLSKDEVVAKYQRMRQDEQTKRAKIQELMSQEAEFRVVIETLKPVDPDRRCYHQIGGVLAERTVKEVLPVLEVNRDGLAKLLTTLEAEFAKTVQERSDFQVSKMQHLSGPSKTSVNSSCSSAYSAFTASKWFRRACCSRHSVPSCREAKEAQGRRSSGSLEVVRFHPPTRFTTRALPSRRECGSHRRRAVSRCACSRRRGSTTARDRRQSRGA